MNKITQEQLTLSEYVFIKATMSQWSGKAALSFEGDLGVENSEKILNGQKMICPAELIRPFQALDKLMADRLDKIGVRFLTPHIWAVPICRIDDARQMLAEVEAKFTAALTTFEDNYDDACEGFFTGKQFEKQLRGSKVPLSVAKTKFTFSNAVFQFAKSEHTTGVSEEVLYDSFTTSIAAQAREIFTGWEKRQHLDELRASSTKGLFLLYQKIKSFETISPHAYALSRHLESMLAGFPQGKKLSGEEISTAYAIISLLKDEANIKDFGSSLLLMEESQSASPGTMSNADDLPDEVVALFGHVVQEVPQLVTQASDPEVDHSVFGASAMDIHNSELQGAHVSPEGLLEAPLFTPPSANEVSFQEDIPLAAPVSEAEFTGNVDIPLAEPVDVQADESQRQYEHMDTHAIPLAPAF